MMNYIAQRIENPQLIDSVRNLTSGEYINRLIPAIINILFIVSVVAFILLLLIGGTQWILSGGNKQSLENARNKIINAITGLLILLLLWIIIQMVNRVFGINLGGLGIGNQGGSAGSAVCQTHCGSMGQTAWCGVSNPPSGCTNDGLYDCSSPTADCYCCGSTAPTPALEQDRCTAAGGVWELLPSSCADICGCGIGMSIVTMGCNCGAGCWQDPVCQTLIPTPLPSVTAPPGYYNFSMVPICSNGNNPQIQTAISWFYFFPFVYNTDNSYGIGTRSIQLPALMGGSTSHIWIGLTNYDSVIIPGSSNNFLKPLDPLPVGWSSTTAFNPYTWWVQADVSNAPASGNYTFNFEVPDIYCNGAANVPSPVPGLTWILTSGVSTTCNQVCNTAGLTCQMIDFDHERIGGENQYVDWPGLSCLVANGNCSTALTQRSGVCGPTREEYRTAWTYCGCI